MSVVEIVDHPLIQHKISLLRDRNTGTKEFRDLVSEIAMLLCYEATRDLPTEEVEVETPVALARTKVLAGRKLALVPILRAGLGMVDGMLNLIPAAKVGHIGMYRNEETLVPVEYYCKLPNDINEREVFVLDPMRLRRHRPDQEARCQAHQVHRPGRRAPGPEGPARGPPRCGHLCRRTGREAER
jgi:uracil phosphoribosyltransferase